MVGSPFVTPLPMGREPKNSEVQTWSLFRITFIGVNPFIGPGRNYWLRRFAKGSISFDSQTFECSGDEAGTVPDQRGCDLLRLAAERLVERRDAVCVRRVDVCAVRDEKLDGGGVGVGGRPVQQGVATGAPVDLVGVDATGELVSEASFCHAVF